MYFKALLDGVPPGKSTRDSGSHGAKAATYGFASASVEAGTAITGVREFVEGFICSPHN